MPSHSMGVSAHACAWGVLDRSAGVRNYDLTVDVQLFRCTGTDTGMHLPIFGLVSSSIKVDRVLTPCCVGQVREFRDAGQGPESVVSGEMREVIRMESPARTLPGLGGREGGREGGKGSATSRRG